MHRKYSPVILQALGALFPSQQGQDINNPVTIYNISRNFDQHQGNGVESSSKQDQRFTRGMYEIMDVNRCPNEAGSPESIVLEESPKRMKWALIHTIEFGYGDIHRLHIRLKTQRSQGKSSTIILRQNDNSIVREEVWGDNITQTTRNFGRNLEELSKNEYQTASDLCPIIIESSGCFNQTDCSDRMVTVQYNFFEAELAARAPRRGSVCIPTEKEGEDLLQLVPGRQCSRPERTSLKLVRMDQPILLPTLELDIPGGSKTAQGADNNDFSHPNVEVCIMFPQPNSTVNITSDNTTSNNGNSRPRKRKFPALKQQDRKLMAWRVSGVFSKLKVSEIMPLTVSFQTNDVLNFDPDTVLSISAF
ncbi:hypothetical protein AYI68_g6695 [Smittium mucronatum]|uniref:Uncharacterized protein n=1 Tax=Smittium mucronatum TaxID=133383 RepID=A0A1R0GQS5_9FUNG|nr:hypothetical protein AYI68_g6695 [Smittium mucronatum]